LNDYAVQVTAKPSSKLTLLSAIHWFNAANNNDATYNIAGAPVGGSIGKGSNIGQELDLIGTYVFNPNFDVQLGYSWFWYGTRINNTPPLNRDDATQLYLQTSLRY
jgi:hypothetical protein